MKQIPLTQGKVAIVDEEDYEMLSAHSWCYHVKNGKGYASRGYRKSGKVVILKMHHAILGKPPAGFQIDHINGDGLDNRKSNLRVVTNQQNQFNQRKRKKRTSSQYKGVSWHVANCKWRARISLNGKDIHLGYFQNEQDAARAYNVAALKYFGEYAKLNEI